MNGIDVWNEIISAPPQKLQKRDNNYLIVKHKVCSFL